MDNQQIIDLCKLFYTEKTSESISFINTVADFVLENKDIVVNEDLRPLVAPLYNLWTINALPEILNGRLFISEAFINSMLTQVSANSSVLKSIDVNCYDSGNVDFMVSHQMGRFLIKGEIVECSHNNQKSILVFCINN